MKILIVGAGIAGCTISRMLCEKNEILIIEKNNFIGGNCYDYIDDTKSFYIHQFGPHIFHTNNEKVWLFINQFSHFKEYINQVLVSINDQLVQMPINLNSIKSIFNDDFDNFYNEIAELGFINKTINISNLLSSLKDKRNKEIVQFFFDNVFANYTAKMWGIKIEDIDKSIIDRVKINLNWEWNYFPHDKYCGLPINGYSQLFKNMINHKNIKLILNIDVNKITIDNHKLMYDGKEFDYVIYTGSIDELLAYKFGALEYRSLFIEFCPLKEINQDKAIINYPSHPTITRICDYKLLTSDNKSGGTIISKESPGQYDINDPKYNRRYYPINNDKNKTIYNQYMNELRNIKNLILLGRLAEYKYYDMDKIIERCFEIASKLN